MQFWPSLLAAINCAHLLVQVCVGCLQEAGKEGMRGGQGQVEVQGVEHHLLHGQNLLAGVCLVRDVNEVANLGRPNLLVLGGDQHSSDADLPTQMDMVDESMLAMQSAMQTPCASSGLWNPFHIPSWSSLPSYSPAAGSCGSRA